MNESNDPVHKTLMIHSPLTVKEQPEQSSEFNLLFLKEEIIIF